MGRMQRILAKHKEYIGWLRKCYPDIGKAINAWTPAERGAIIFTKHTEYIGWVWTCYPTLQKNNKCANARGARGLNHYQPQGIHICIMKMILKHIEFNKCVNARGARAKNHCQTQGIQNDCEHITQTFGKTINAWTLAGLVQIIIANRKANIGLLRTCYPNIWKSNKCVNARKAFADNHSKTQGVHWFIANMLSKHAEKQ